MRLRLFRGCERERVPYAKIHSLTLAATPGTAGFGRFDRFDKLTAGRLTAGDATLQKPAVIRHRRTSRPPLLVSQFQTSSSVVSMSCVSYLSGKTRAKCARSIKSEIRNSNLETNRKSESRKKFKPPASRLLLFELSAFMLFRIV
jgi:hypothetical protein